MADTKPTTIAAYLKALPADRREALEAIRAVVNKNIDTKFAEGMQYGMPAWFVPHSVYPAGYHCDANQPLPFASVASQKNHIGIYLFCIYQDDELREWFVDAWKASGKKLDMGKSCIRVKKLEDVPLDVLGKAVKKMKAKGFIEHYDSVRPDGPKGMNGKVSKNSSKTTAKKVAKKTSKKTTKKVSKKAASKKTTKRR
ncbi:MAG: DUF1801 domain-containing protein [Phycisphaera sp.]|nr:MAG: DUF1801 domain-containing protein [Phycisphaera sp.]